jgi:oligogalacturonide transport system substrate-binding protein
MIKLNRIITVAIVVAVGMVWCASAPAADNVEIRMSWWGGDSRHEATAAALKKFTEKYPNIKVKPEFTGWTGHLEKISTQIAGGTEADLLQINWNWLTIFSKRGDGFADLNDYKDIIDLSQWNEEMLSAGTMGDKLCGLTVSITGRVFFLNKTTFDKAGVAIPKTWDALIAAANIFKAKLGEEYYPFDATRQNAWLMSVLLATQQTGKSFIDPETNKIAWTEDELAEALSFYQKLVDEGVLKSLKEGAAEGEVQLHEKKEWMEGKLAGSYEWDSTYNKYNDPIENGELVPVSTLRTKDAVSEGMFRKPAMMFAISKNSKHPKEAATLLNFLLNDPDAIKILGTSRGIPASKKAEALLTKENLIDPTVAAAHEIIVKGEAPPISPYFEHFKLLDLYEKTLEEMAYNKISADKAAANIINDGNRILKRLSR